MDFARYEVIFARDGLFLPSRELTVLIKTQHVKAAFWGFDLVLTAVTVFFLVRAAQFLFIQPLHVPDQLTDASPPSPVLSYPDIRPYEAYAPLRSSKLFGALSSANVAAKPVEEELPKTTLELELLGCVSDDTPQLSFAIIRDKKNRSEGTYAIGDFIVSDAKVEEIRDSEVVISRAGRREILTMTFSKESPFASASRAFSSAFESRFPAPSRGSPESRPAIRVVNENLRYINREQLLQEVQQNLGQLLNQFRTSPNDENGKPAGVRVDATGSDPLSAQAGIKPGDVVKSVNGIRINSFDEIFNLQDRLKNAREIRVVIERDGRHRTLVYKIR